MKKLFVVVFCIVFNGLLFAYSTPIMGYNKVPWGASIPDVIRAFNIDYNLRGIAFHLFYHQDDQNIVVLQEFFPNRYIISRAFLFNGWRGNHELYRVQVTYSENSDEKWQNLQNLFANKFGEKTGYSNNQQAPGFYDITYIFGQYSPELLVELVRSTSMMSNQQFINVIYTWERFRNAYLVR